MCIRDRHYCIQMCVCHIIKDYLLTITSRLHSPRTSLQTAGAVFLPVGCHFYVRPPRQTNHITNQCRKGLLHSTAVILHRHIHGLLAASRNVTTWWSTRYAVIAAITWLRPPGGLQRISCTKFVRPHDLDIWPQKSKRHREHVQYAN